MSVRTIAVLSSKGGVGKTTLSTHLAAWLHLQGARVLLLDLDDEQGSASDWAASRGEASRLSGLPVIRQDRPLTMERYIRVLQQGTKPWDYVVLDGPPRLSETTRAAARLVDLIVVPVKADQYAVWALGKTRRLLEEADVRRGAEGHPPAGRLYVLTQARRKSRLAETAAAAVGAVQPGLVTMHDSVAYGAAAISGETVLSWGRRSAAAAEVEQLAGEVRRMLKGVRHG